MTPTSWRRRTRRIFFSAMAVSLVQVGLVSPVAGATCTTAERSSTVTYRRDQFTTFKQTVWYKLEGDCVSTYFYPKRTYVRQITASITITDPGNPSMSRFTRSLGFPQLKQNYYAPAAWLSDTYATDSTFPISITRTHYPARWITYDQGNGGSGNNVSFHCDCGLFIGYHGFRLWHWFNTNTYTVQDDVT